MGFDNQGGSPAEAKGNKKKQNGFFLFPFISFYFPESGLFKGLQPKEIKKSLSFPARAAGCGLERCQTAAASPRSGPPAGAHRFRQ
jgi:hypothetical protein